MRFINQNDRFLNNLAKTLMKIIAALIGFSALFQSAGAQVQGTLIFCAVATGWYYYGCRYTCY
jgi:hypothetical protein